MAFLYRHRNLPAGTAACAVVALAIYSQTHRPLAPKKENPLEPVQVTIAEMPPPPPAPTPPPAPVTPPPPSPQPPRPTPPSPAPSPPTPKAVAQPTAAPTPNPIPVVEAPPPAAPSPSPAPPAPTPPPPAPAAPAVDVSAQYTAKVRAYLNATKRYPTGREASIQRPEGKVRIVFVLRRDGSLVSAEVEDSSNSILLDNAGLAAIRRGSLPPFDTAFGNEETHRFTVDLDFKAPS